MKAPTAQPRSRYLAVIDIGSNSVRLVIYSGLKRAPDIVFNEKVICGLGQDVGTTGAMGDEAMDRALSTLRRFKALCDQADIEDVIIIATAAVRDATNGDAFVKMVSDETGQTVRVINGEEEAKLAAMGVVCGLPEANGLVGDLGGGSLEIAHVKEGVVGKRISLPIGPLRLMSEFGKDRKAMKKFLRAEFAKITWIQEVDAKNFYLVGGAWRNIVKLLSAENVRFTQILHGLRIDASDMQVYTKRLAGLDIKALPNKHIVSSSRHDVLPTASLILREFIKASKVKYCTVSALGVREGLLYEKMDAEMRASDPFLSACEEISIERSRFAEHANDLYQWTRPLYARKSYSIDPNTERLHKAICMLSDIAWRGHPDFRAEKAVEAIMHGNFIGISPQERVYVAVALNEAYGASMDVPWLRNVIPMLKIEDLMIARTLGAALRLAQRITGGTAYMLSRSRLELGKKKLYLLVDTEWQDLANRTVAKRLKNLGAILGKNTSIVFDDDTSL